MRWFRSNIRLGARLALFALAVQILLSFAHVHLADAARAPALGAAQTLADGSGAPPKKPSPLHGSLDPGCAICALIQLAATSPPSAAPVLRLPAMLGHARPEPSLAVALAASPHSLFQARAPPAA